MPHYHKKPITIEARQYTGDNLQTRVHEGATPDPGLIATWARVVKRPPPPVKDPGRRLNAAFVEWLMGLPSDNAANLSRCARIRLAGNAVVAQQVSLMLQRALRTLTKQEGTVR